MRRFITILMTTLAAMAFFATTADAYRMGFQALNYTPGNTLNTSDTITVQVYLDTQYETNIRLFSVSVFFDPLKLSYVKTSSNANGEGTFAFPYMLFDPSGGRTGPPATYLVPTNQPPNFWTGTKPPGIEQINVNWQESNLTNGYDTRVASRYVPAATIVFSALQALDSGNVADIAISFTGGGNVFSVSGSAIQSSVALFGTPIKVPEPTSAMLAFGALSTVYGLYHVRRRR
jgi:hypothetical protein